MPLKTHSFIQLLKKSRVGQYFAARFAGPIHSEDHKQPGMIGSGVTFRRNSYITHTTLHHSKSAISTFVGWQLGLILLLTAVVAIGFVINPLSTAIVAVAILSTVYLVDVFFNLFVILKSLHMPPEISITPDNLAKLSPRDLPTYTILCPLYKEAHVLPQFIEAMQKMEWPSHKLEVMLLLEEDDDATISAAKQMLLPKNFRIVVVPDSKPKTKPKACNYGLGMARGEYIVVYDAEDQPDPMQLKQAYYAFKSSSKDVVCLQAKLNYYNPTHNMLTRLFTAEYSLWFDVILPGLQSINTSIPLGGTSNHFRTSDLRELEGWDPFNVTEDCDLGARIFQAGYKTAIIDSTTLEEANSNVKNWFRQRSRWLKGYMQTYLVHMRNPLSFMRRHGIHALIFQLIVGGRIAFILINPLLWALTLAYFALYSYMGPAIEAIYPGPVFYMAVTSLLLGNFTYLYNYMIGCAKRGHWNLVKYVFLIPIYWLMISYAATIALFQLFFKPHYWEKTIHGLHLDYAKKLTNSLTQKSESQKARARRVQRIAEYMQNVWNAGGVMVFASLFNNFMNFAYNAYLSRRVDLTTFGDVSLFSSLIYLASIPISALSRTMTHASAYLLGKYRHPVKQLWSLLLGRVFRVTTLLGLIWLLLIPWIQKFFHTDSPILFLVFIPVWIISAVSAVNGGFLSGNLVFTVLAITAVVEALTKLVLTTTFITFNFQNYLYVATPLSMLLVLWIESRQIYRLKSNIKSNQIEVKDLKLSKKFYFTSILTTLTKATYLGLDVVLAKHFLSPEQAGSYSYIALAGKMVFFLSTMFSQFLIPYVSRDIGAGRPPKTTFLKLLTLVALVNIFAIIFFGYLGSYTAPILWGSKVSTIIGYLTPYSIAMALFSISSLIVTYQQIRKRYIFPVVGFVVGCVQIFGMLLMHQSTSDLVQVVLISSIVSVVVVVSMSLFYKTVIDIMRAITDFLGLFRPLAPRPPLSSGKLRILIFNWRDLRHRWAGGAEVYIHELSKVLVKKGHEVTIFSGSDGKSGRHEKIDGVRIVRHGGFYLVYFWAYVYYSLRLRGRYDIIIDSENGLPFFTPIYAKEKVFLLIHHVHQEVFRKSLIPPFSWIAQFLEKRVMPLVYRKTDVLTVSPSSKAEIIAHRLTQRDPHIVYNGVNLKHFKPGKKSKDPMILYLGRLTTAKSVDILILSAQKIIKSMPRVKVVIAGDGPCRKSLMRLVKKLKLENSITFAGKVSEDQKLSLYQQAWVFVNPSLIEGWGITTIEANACGTPVVASNVAGLRDAVDNNHSGFLVPYGNIAEFKRSIIKLLTSSALRNQMSRESIAWAKKYDWSKSASHLLRVISANDEIVFARSDYQLFLAQLFRRKPNTIDTKNISIPGYKLVSTINNSGMESQYLSGIYQKDNNGTKKYYIKTCLATTNNYAYLSLLNQYLSSKYLNQVLSSSSKTTGKYRIKTIPPLTFIRTSQTLSIVYEYCAGKSLSAYSQDKQAQVINEVITKLSQISYGSEVGIDSRQSPRLVSKLSLSINSVFYAALFTINNPSNFALILKLLYRSILGLVKVDSSRLVLVHRDIKADNIIVDKNNIYLIDNEQMLYSVAGYDLAQVKVSSLNMSVKDFANDADNLNAKLLFGHILLMKLSHRNKNYLEYLSMAKKYLQQPKFL